MCTVDKLLIKGIRSFSPDNKDVIEFYRPLTLIVGQNGAGKTTVIECLKQACTGELPPNTRSGQSFIHDPKVAGETEVKAQIKLRFRTSTQQPVVVQRSFQLTQKKAKLEFKSLDSVLQTYNKETGEKQALTYRCADIDRIVPSLMGVSKAVLENVVFVHQEDSNWPLAEGKVLKDRFDDIFAATKYTKALKELRGIQKQKSQDLKMMKERLAHLKTHKDNAAQLKVQIAEAKEKTRKYLQKIQELEAQIRAKAEAQKPFAEKLDKMNTLIGKAGQLDATLKFMSAEAMKRLEEIKDGDTGESKEELEDLLAQFHDLVVKLETEERTKTAARQRKAAEGDKCSTEYTQQVQRKGGLEANAKAHLENIHKRDQFILEAAPSLGLSPPAGSSVGDIPPTFVSSFGQAVQEKVNRLHSQLEQLRQKHRSEDNAMLNSVQAKLGELSNIQAGISAKKQQLRQNQSEAEKISELLGTLIISEEMVDETRAREREAKQRYAARKLEVDALKLDDAISGEDMELQKLHRQITTLRQERIEVEQTSRMAAQLQGKKGDLLRREEELNSLVNAKRNRLCAILGKETMPEVERLNSAFQVLLDRKRRELNEATAQLRGVLSTQSQAQGELNTVRSQLRQQETRLQQARQELRTGMLRLLGAEQSEEQYPQKCEESETKKESMMQVTAMANSMLSVLQTFQHDVQYTNCCPLCTRGFKGQEKQVCLDSIAGELQSIPDQIAEKMRELEQLQQISAGLKGLQPLWHRYSDIKANALPPLREREAALTQQLQLLSSRVEDQEHVKNVSDMELQESTRMLQEVVFPMQNQHAEVMKLRRELAALQDQLARSGVTRTVADVNNDMEDVESKQRRHQREKDDLQQRQNKLNQELAQLLSACDRSEGDLRSAMEKMQRKYDALERLQNLEQASVDAEGQIQALSARQGPLNAEHERLVRQRDAGKAKALEAESSLQETLLEASRQRDQWRGLNTRIDKYETEGQAAALARCIERVEALNAEKQAIEAVLAEVDTDLRSVQSRKTDIVLEQENIEKLLRFRRAQAQEAAVREELQSVNAQIAQVGNLKELHQALTDLENERNELSGQRSKLQGALTEQDNIKRTQEKELTKPVFRNIDQQYLTQSVEYRTTEMANSDLDKYHKALEKALLTFHTTKMGDINKVIKELWQKTYQGQDIDYIQIKADADAQRSYNYRVVMYFGGAELEMRGRCSAGQKVLASLIIRLALAETFCLNCGILALDEPTTNLDADNSAGLAEALRSIITARQDQENFQLLVITHDERFAQMIGTREHAENLWRITKDENHHTHVACESILD